MEDKISLQEDVNSEQSILNAAENLFLDRGYAMTSIADIARQVGCNTALVHYYFRTKDRLFESIFDRKFQLFLDSFLSIPLLDLAFEEKLRMICYAHFDFIAAHPKLPFLLINEITTNPDRITRFRDIIMANGTTIVDVLQSQIDSLSDRGLIRPLTAVDLIFTIASLNVMAFLALPLIMQLDLIDRKNFLSSRREEIANTVLASLKKIGD